MSVCEREKLKAVQSKHTSLTQIDHLVCRALVRARVDRLINDKDSPLHRQDRKNKYKCYGIAINAHTEVTAEHNHWNKVCVSAYLHTVVAHRAV